MSAVLSLANDEIVRAVLQTIGVGRTAANMDAATEADVRAIIRSGLRQFWFPVTNGFTYQWRFREKHASINVEAVYETGTIGVSAGTITLAAGTFPSWLADGFIRVSGHVLFITTRTDDTHLVTSNTALTVAAGTAYEAFRYRYALPTDFAEWLGGVVYANGTDSRMLAGSSESEIRLRYAVGQGLSTITTHFAIASTPTADALRILLWPVPEPDAFIQGVYLSVPEDNLPASLTVPGSVVQCAPVYAEAVVEAILAAAEVYIGQTQGIHEARFQAALATAINHDKSVGGHYDLSRPVQDTRGCGNVLPLDFSSQL